MGSFVYHDSDVPEEGKKEKWLEGSEEVGE